MQTCNINGYKIRQKLKGEGDTVNVLIFSLKDKGMQKSKSFLGIDRLINVYRGRGVGLFQTNVKSVFHIII